MQGTYTKAVLVVSLLTACGGSNDGSAMRADTAAAPATVAQRPAILILGTSLTAGYGIDLMQAWPAGLAAPRSIPRAFRFGSSMRV